MQEHQATAGYLDAIADEHHPSLGHGIGKGTDKRGQDHIGNGKHGFQQRLIAFRRLHVTQHGDGGNQQSVIGKRRKELRGHDDVKTGFHA